MHQNKASYSFWEICKQMINRYCGSVVNYRHDDVLIQSQKQWYTTGCVLDGYWEAFFCPR